MTNDSKEKTVTYEPKAFQKGDAFDVATSARQAVALRFRGYREIEAVEATPVVEDGDEPSYAELQAQARDLNEAGHEIKINAKHEDLLDAVIEAQTFENEVK